MAKGEYATPAGGEQARMDQSPGFQQQTSGLRVATRGLVPARPGSGFALPGTTESPLAPQADATHVVPRPAGGLRPGEAVVVTASAGSAAGGEQSAGKVEVTQGNVPRTADAAGGEGDGTGRRPTIDGEAGDGENAFRITVGTPEPGQRTLPPRTVVMVETRDRFVLASRPVNQGEGALSGRWGFFGGHAASNLGEAMRLESESPLSLLWRGDYHNSRSNKTGQRVTCNVSLYHTEIASTDDLTVQVDAGMGVVAIPKTLEAIKAHREQMTDFTYQALIERLRTQDPFIITHDGDTRRYTTANVIAAILLTDGARESGKPVDAAIEKIAQIGFKEPPRSTSRRKDKAAWRAARERQREFLTRTDDMETAADIRAFPNYFAIFSPNASPDELAARYEELKQQYQGTDPESVAQVKMLTAAYEILSGPKRDDYDRLYISYGFLREIINARYSGDSDFVAIPGGSPTTDEVMIAGDQRNGTHFYEVMSRSKEIYRRVLGS